MSGRRRHHDSCPKLIHEVRKLYRPAVLVHTEAHPEGELSRKLRAEGWKLLARRQGTCSAGGCCAGAASA